MSSLQRPPLSPVGLRLDLLVEKAAASGVPGFPPVPPLLPAIGMGDLHGVKGRSAQEAHSGLVHIRFPLCSQGRAPLTASRDKSAISPFRPDTNKSCASKSLT